MTPEEWLEAAEILNVSGHELQTITLSDQRVVGLKMEYIYIQDTARHFSHNDESPRFWSQAYILDLAQVEALVENLGLALERLRKFELG